MNHHSTPEPQTLSFNVINAESGKGVSNAKFDLYQNSEKVGTAQSGADGKVAFNNIQAGAYQLVQSAYPRNLQGLSIHYNVSVDNRGSVKLGGESVHSMRVLNFPRRRV